MRSYLMAAVVLVFLWAGFPALAQTAAGPDAALEELLGTLKAPAAVQETRLLRTPEGYVRFLGAPAGGWFDTEASATKSGTAPEAVAQQFVSRYAGAFGKVSLQQNFTTDRITSSGETNYVRLQQTYNGFTVFGAQMLVQLDGQDGVQCVSSDIAHDFSTLDAGEVSLTPAITAAMAKNYAKGYVAGLSDCDAGILTTTGTQRMVLDPSVVGAQGELCVVFELKVVSQSERGIGERVFVNVKNGAVAFSYPLIHNAKNRTIYNGGSIFPPAMTVMRREGDPPTGLRDADMAYDYFGDTYDFYLSHHDRDSIDARGMEIRGVVYFCLGQCPMHNAFWLGHSDDDLFFEYFGMLSDTMYFGEGYAAADDVIAHELTHGVTSYSSNLIYAYQSGAINESFSDIWGEFVDLTNGKGNDSDEVRWWMGEDLPDEAIRDMEDPTRFGDPDRTGSEYYYHGTADNGGVHQNSGVVNKLCYLLTDGDTFNGYTIEPMGIEVTADLFYECQANILTEASDFADLYMALGQASANLGLSLEEKLNVRAAARAVEIAPTYIEEEIRLFRAVPAYTTRNRPVIALYWTLPNNPALRQVILVRTTGAYAQAPSEGFEIYRGLGEKFLDDTGIAEGVTYYYTLFAEVSEGFPSAVYANATAGAAPPDFLTEEYLKTFYPGYTVNPFDLSFSQILFSPTGPPSGSLGSAGNLGDYDNYTVTVRKNVYEFPVPRGDTDHGSIDLKDLMEDLGVWCNLDRPFPFFQKEYTRIYLASNGYIAFEGVSEWSNNNFPSYYSHFALPRISFLFADLAPKIGGSAWAKFLDDRLVCTFLDMPQWDDYSYPPSASPNSVQVELFYSGHIRITYGGVNIDYGIVGLSDGRGAPQDPADLFENLKSVPSSTDFSSFSNLPTAISIEPIVPPVVEAGDVAQFSVKATAPAGLGYPSLWAEWDHDGPIFIDEGGGNGYFSWETTMEDFGEYTVRVFARLGSEIAYQDVRVWVAITEPVPAVTNVGIRTNNPVEDPTRNRTVSDDTELIVQYTYTHPMQYILPEYYEEGGTEILWFQNNSHRPSLNNLRVVPPNYTRPNDTWFFQITPETVYGERGMHVLSPVVTVLALPEILDVVRIEDLPDGEVLPEELPLPGVPIAWGPSSGGAEVVILGRKLSNITCIKIGGIECTSINSINDSRVDVIAPPHIPSPIANGEPVPEKLVVSTSAGTSAIPDAFVYVASGTVISKADVNQDGVVNAVDVQLVINAVLGAAKNGVDADVNRDGRVNSVDIQAVINEALRVF